MITESRVDTNAFADMDFGNFDALLARSPGQPLVPGIALHGYIVGQPYRLCRLRRPPRHIVTRRNDAWLCRSGGIARHVARLRGGIVA
ncbi:MAG TPA: hypothetical protein VLG66_00130 [Alphaproteobacteria bacterium]|nr:hypothetical protein [Alphaproteobacteria bacterium]